MSGPKCATCDFAQNSSSTQMIGEMANCVYFGVRACGNMISSWSARVVAHVNGVKRTLWMEAYPWWRHWHRTGHRWIEKCKMNWLTAIRGRILCSAGHVARMDCSEICAEALRCRFLQWWGWRQLYWKEVEKNYWAGPHPKRSKVCGNVNGFAESAQQSTGWLQFAHSRGSGGRQQGH